MHLFLVEYYDKKNLGRICTFLSHSENFLHTLQVCVDKFRGNVTKMVELIKEGHALLYDVQFGLKIKP